MSLAAPPFCAELSLPALKSTGKHTVQQNSEIVFRQMRIVVKEESCIIDYSHVTISYNGRDVVSDVSFTVKPGEILGIVGESGSGKSTLLRAAMGLLGQGGLVTRGDIWYDGKDLPDLSPKEMRKINGDEISMIFQDSGASFAPIRTIGSQIEEALAAHRQPNQRDRAIEVFEKLGLRDPEKIWDSYPFEMSGGMNQRIGIAAAMLTQPKILMADEPTSALDAAVQKQALDELLLARKLYGTAILLVTHDISVVRYMADSVLVLRHGKMVEYGTKEQVLDHPRDAYTKQLLSAAPHIMRA